MKLYLSSYFYDPDHPYGIVLMETSQEKLEKYPLLNSICTELIKTGETQEFTRDYDRNELSKEIIRASKENKILSQAIGVNARRGWSEYSNMELPNRSSTLNWAIIELAINKEELFNDSFWGEEVDKFLEGK